MSTPAIDVLALMAGNQIGILSACQSQTPGTPGGAQPMYPWLNGPAGMLAEMKNPSGWPCDLYTFDSKYIYQTVTEVDDNATDYNNPKTYKQFQSASTLATPAANGGIIWMPRFYTPGSPEVLIQTPDSSYVEYINGVAQPKQNLGGPTMVGFSGPWNDVNFGGNIGQQPYYLQRYLYNPAFNTQEQNAYVVGLGRIRWQLFNVIAGLYALSKTVLYNASVAGPCPKLAWVPA
jgi:hypothetical protein